MRPGLALIEPEIAGNVGAILRTAACFECAVHIVEPCGFPFSDRSLRRSGMDYAQRVTVHRHAALDPFVAEQRRLGRRIILATTRGATCYTDFAFAAGEVQDAEAFVRIAEPFEEQLDVFEPHVAGVGRPALEVDAAKPIFEGLVEGHADLV